MSSNQSADFGSAESRQLFLLNAVQELMRGVTSRGQLIRNLRKNLLMMNQSGSMTTLSHILIKFVNMPMLWKFWLMTAIGNYRSIENYYSLNNSDFEAGAGKAPVFKY